ncbi:MAG: hypothetical protein HZA00_12615 [Nitrospinae bacterium]|nr:hypothetical protein [Nitrospinota bacterium]
MRKTIILFVLFILGCAQSVIVTPSPIVFPNTVLTEWEGQNIQITVLDYRPDEAVKVNVSSSIIDTLRQSNRKVNWQSISNPNLIKLDNPFLTTC